MATGDAIPLQPDLTATDATKVTQKEKVSLEKPKDSAKKRPLFDELSTNRGWTLGLQPSRLVNPDILIGRKGLKVYREMMRDDQVKAAMTLKKHAVLATGWRIVPADEDSPRATALAEFVDDVLREELEGDLEDDIKEILTALAFGYSVTEIVYKPVTRGRWKGKVGLSKLATRLPENFTFRVDEHDNLLPDGVEQFGKPLPASRFLIMSNAKEFDNWYGRSDLHEAYQWWWFKTNTIKWWSIFMDRYGIPLAEGVVQPQAALDKGDVGKLQNILDNLQANTSIIHPNSVELRFPTIGSAAGSAIFDMAITRADRGIAKAILIPSLLGVSEQGDVGSYSQSRTQFDVFILVVEAIQRYLARYVLGSQLIKRLVDLNFGTDEYPKFEFLPFTETNKAMLISQFNQCIAAGIVQPRPEDEVYVRNLTQFPKVPLEQVQQELAQKQLMAQQQEMMAAQQGGMPGQPGQPGQPGGGPPGQGGPPQGQGAPPAGGPPQGAAIPEAQIDAMIQEALSQKPKRFTDAQPVRPAERTHAYAQEALTLEDIIAELRDAEDRGDLDQFRDHSSALDAGEDLGSVAGAVDDEPVEDAAMVGDGGDQAEELPALEEDAPELDDEAAVSLLMSLPTDEELNRYIAEARLGRTRLYAMEVPLLEENETWKMGPGNEPGVWRTIRGHHIFIKKGNATSIPEAIKRERKEWNWKERRGKDTTPEAIATNEVPWIDNPKQAAESFKDLGLPKELQEALTPTAVRFRDPLGEWLPERVAQVHEPLLKRALDAVQPSPYREKLLASGAKPRLMIFAGSFGSGKPEVKEHFLSMADRDVLKVTPALIQEHLPEFTQLKNSEYAKAARVVTMAEAQELALRLLQAGMARKQDMALDTVLAHPEQVKAIIGHAKDEGYEVGVVYVHTPFEEAKARVKKRTEKFKSDDIPDTLMERSALYARRAFDDYKHLLDGWKVYRTQRQGQPPLLLAEGGGEQHRVIDTAGYEEFMRVPRELPQPKPPVDGSKGEAGWHLPGVPSWL